MKQKILIILVDFYASLHVFCYPEPGSTFPEVYPDKLYGSDRIRLRNTAGLNHWSIPYPTIQNSLTFVGFNSPVTEGKGIGFYTKESFCLSLVYKPKPITSVTYSTIKTGYFI